MKIQISLLMALFSLTVHAQTLDSMYTNPGNLTDNKAKEAQNFQHEGYKAAIIKKACETDKALKDGKCDEANIDNEGALIKGEFGASIEKNIGKVYGMLFGGLNFLTGSDPKIGMTTAKGTALTKDEKKTLKKEGAVAGEGEKSKPKAEQKSDYCLYGAIGYELIAGMMQLQGQKNNANIAITDPQLQALISLKEAHKTRKRTATYQSAIYGATTACYAARFISQGALIVDKLGYIAKWGGAAALTTLYIAKASKHAKAEKAVDRVIASLPKDGNCNPWTGTTCFCSEPSSKTLYPTQYEEVCILNKGNFDAPAAEVGCGVLKDNVMTYDAACECKKTNTCFKATLTAYSPNFSLGSNFMNDANKGYGLLSGGDFEQGKFDSYSLQSAANAKRIKDKVDTSGVKAVTLNKDQKKTADDLKGILPPSLAAVAGASEPSSPPGGGLMGESTQTANYASISPELQKKIDEATSSGYSTKGSGFEVEGASGDSEITLPQIGGATQEEGGAEVMNFAEEAVSQADVTKRTDTPIFDIISHRYRSSGWNKLEEKKK